MLSQSHKPLTGRRPRTGASRLSPRPGQDRASPGDPLVLTAMTRRLPPELGPLCANSRPPTARFAGAQFPSVLSFRESLYQPRARPHTAQFPLLRAEVVRRKGGDLPARVRVPARKRRGMQITVAL
ncbi:hypothetical protein mRhiFer1_008963 [Rhinolophus ferrumequinum]|uniref:Uncharacterized protein n=1 Tax=Rhinolophus ferrumequinum TaxID=59479 RepID=A0A7J7TEG7_RHIFE|nr:hypothetical protein mRhiFer1_008963 [Rhinolophus ferrumequinum]